MGREIRRKTNERMKDRTRESGRGRHEEEARRKVLTAKEERTTKEGKKIYSRKRED